MGSGLSKLSIMNEGFADPCTTKLIRDHLITMTENFPHYRLHKHTEPDSEMSVSAQDYSGLMDTSIQGPME
jgi:hypothetical protein